MISAAYNPEFLKFCISSSLATDQYGELEKRLKFCPFSRNEFVWRLVHTNGPKFFVLRDMLRKGGYAFTVCDEPMTLTSLENTALLTAYCIEDRMQARVRGKWLEADKMPLYVEAGNWDVPQINPLFDWTDAQAWGYLIHVGLETL